MTRRCDVVANWFRLRLGASGWQLQPEMGVDRAGEPLKQDTTMCCIIGSGIKD
jgi:hypothetical protein